jgi:hypothetical protein
MKREKHVLLHVQERTGYNKHDIDRTGHLYSTASTSPRYYVNNAESIDSVKF